MSGPHSQARASAPVALGVLLDALPMAAVYGPRDRDVGGLAQDSREVVTGGAFVAIVGFGVDGHDYVHSALRAGAGVIVAERGRPVNVDSEVTWVRVPDTRAALAAMACAFFDHPSRDVDVLAVTGTNGKTSVAWMLKQLVEAAGRRAGLLSTVERHLGETVEPTLYTTPPAHDLQGALARMRDAGLRHAVIEASSHGLALGRTAGTRVAVGGFTNLSRDHLDFHADMADYEAAKARLFGELSQSAAFFVDDAAGARMAAAFDGPKWTVSLGDVADADLRVTALALDTRGARGALDTPEGPRDFELPLHGAHNVANALVAVAMAALAGVPLDTALGALPGIQGAPGRLEAVRAVGVDGPLVLVDYAHTPEALATVLAALRPLVPAGGSLVTVFGAGGDRDPGKRPQMAAAAAAGADRVVVTSDNPRTEDPEVIIDDVSAGFVGHTTPWSREVDRRAAIHSAVATAGPTDLVLIAGKGHETTQTVGATRHAFDDRIVAAEALRARAGRPGEGDA